MTRGWTIVLGALVAIAIGFGIGYLVFDDGHGSGDDHGLRHDRMAGMMADGSMPEMMADFTAMMEQMREGMTPEVREQMDRDAMWELMESGQMAELMEHHMQSMGDMPGMGAGHGGPHGGMGDDG